MSPQSNRKAALGQWSTFKKKPRNPTIWLCDTGQRIPCFDRCQLTIAWMCNIKGEGNKSRLFLSNFLLDYGCHFAQLHRRHRRMCPRVTLLVMISMRKSIQGFSFLYGYGAPLGGPSGCQSFILKMPSLCLW